MWLALALAVLAATAAVLVFTAGMARGMEMAFLPQAFPWAGASSAGIIGGADGPTAVFVTSYAGIFSMGPLDALVMAGALLSFYFLCRAAGIHGAKHLRIARALAGICAAVFCVRFFLAVAMLSLAEGSLPALARDVFISRVPAHSHSPGPGDLAHAAKAGKRNGGRKP